MNRALLLFVLLAPPAYGGLCGPRWAEVGGALLPGTEITELPLAAGEHFDSFLKTTKYKSGSLTVEVSEVTLKEKAGEEVRRGWAEKLKGNQSAWKKIIDENLDFAFSQYPRRGWTDGFFDELRAMAHASAERSKYITVRDEAGKVVGTIRFVTSRDPAANLLLQSMNNGLPYPPAAVGGQWTRKVIPSALQELLPEWHSLPVEGALGVNLERPVLVPTAAERPYYPQKLEHFLGEVIEPGNFAIDQKVNGQVYRAIAVELLRGVYDRSSSPDYNQHGKILYTYGDALGKRLYVPMGFDVVDPKDPIEHAGRPWWVLRITPDRLKTWIDTLGKKANWTEQDTADMKAALEAFSAPERILSTVVPNPVAADQHGLSQAAGYSSNAKVSAELTAVGEAQRTAFREAHRGSPAAAEKTAQLYENLLADLAVARVDQRRIIPLWPSALTLKATDNIASGVHIFDSQIKPETLEGMYGPLWEATYVLQSMITDPKYSYRENREAFFSDLRAAAAQVVLQQKESELSSRELNRRLLDSFHALARKRHPNL